MPAARSPTPRPVAAPACPSWPCCAPRRPSPRPPPASASRPATQCWWSAPRPASGPWPDFWTADRHGQRDPGSQSRWVALGQTITTPSSEHLLPWPYPRVAPVRGSDSPASRFDRRASSYEDSTLQQFLFVPVQQTALHLTLQLLPQARRVLDVGCGTGQL